VKEKGAAEPARVPVGDARTWMSGNEKEALRVDRVTGHQDALMLSLGPVPSFTPTIRHPHTAGCAFRKRQVETFA
jgi:hypothetical protein